MGFFSSVYDGIKGALGAGSNAGAQQANQQGRAGLVGNAGNAAGFAGGAAGNYGVDTGNMNAQAGYLQQQQNGQNSVSAEQLRQGLQQNLGAQQSMAAGATPQNAAMAARTAAIQSGRLGSAAAGQQAIAGLQERNQATQNLASLYGTMRGQDLQGALGGYGAANQGYGQLINQQGDQGWLQRNAGAISGIGGAIAASDRRLKRDIDDGEGDANGLLEGLKAYSYRYKDDRYGKGKQLGVMAQDLEKVVPDAVINTPSGKMVNGAKLAGALAAVVPGLHKRIKALEGDEK